MIVNVYSELELEQKQHLDSFDISDVSNISNNQEYKNLETEIEKDEDIEKDKESKESKESKEREKSKLNLFFSFFCNRNELSNLSRYFLALSNNFKESQMNEIDIQIPYPEEFYILLVNEKDKRLRSLSFISIFFKVDDLKRKRSYDKKENKESFQTKRKEKRESQEESLKEEVGCEEFVSDQIERDFFLQYDSYESPFLIRLDYFNLKDYLGMNICKDDYEGLVCENLEEIEKLASRIQFKSFLSSEELSSLSRNIDSLLLDQPELKEEIRVLISSFTPSLRLALSNHTKRMEINLLKSLFVKTSLSKEQLQRELERELEESNFVRLSSNSLSNDEHDSSCSLNLSRSNMLSSIRIDDKRTLNQEKSKQSILYKSSQDHSKESSSSSSQECIEEKIYRLYTVMTIDSVSQELISVIHFPLLLENDLKEVQFLCSHNYILFINNHAVNIYERDTSSNKFRLSSEPITKNLTTGIIMNGCGTSILMNDSSDKTRSTKLMDLKSRAILYENRLIDAYIKTSSENNYFISHKYGYILVNGITGEVIYDVECKIDFSPSCNISVDETKVMIIDNEGNKTIVDLKSGTSMIVNISVQSPSSSSFSLRDWIYSSPNFQHFAYEYRNNLTNLAIYNKYGEKLSNINLPSPHIRHFVSDSYMIDYKDGRVSLINIVTGEIKETEIVNSIFPVHVDDMCICISNIHSKIYLINSDSSYKSIKIPNIPRNLGPSPIFKKYYLGPTSNPLYKVIRVIETTLSSKTPISYYKNSLYL